MDLSFVYFWSQVTANPLLLLAVCLTLGVIFVNGWTDCPNAIAMHGNLDGVNGQAWLKVIYGLVISVVLGFILGYTVCKLVNHRPRSAGIIRAAERAVFLFMLPVHLHP